MRFRSAGFSVLACVQGNPGDQHIQRARQLSGVSCLPPHFRVSILHGVQRPLQLDEAGLGEFASVRWLRPDNLFLLLPPFLLVWGGAWRLLVVPAASVAGGGVKLAGRAALWLPIPHWIVSHHRSWAPQLPISRRTAWDHGAASSGSGPCMFSFGIALNRAASALSSLMA